MAEKWMVGRLESKAATENNNGYQCGCQKSASVKMKDGLLILCKP